MGVALVGHWSWAPRASTRVSTLHRLCNLRPSLGALRCAEDDVRRDTRDKLTVMTNRPTMSPIAQSLDDALRIDYR